MLVGGQNLQKICFLIQIINERGGVICQKKYPVVNF